MRPIRTAFVAVIFVAVVLAGPALAHTTERAFVLILPTELYVTGGTLVVALSFVLIALVPAANVKALEGLVWRVGRLPEGLGCALSLLSYALFIAFAVIVWL